MGYAALQIMLQTVEAFISTDCEGHHAVEQRNGTMQQSHCVQQRTIEYQDKDKIVVLTRCEFEPRC